MNQSLRAAAIAAVVLSSVSRQSSAAEPAVPCTQAVTRSNVVACVLAASPALQEELASQRAAGGRREAVRPFLPSNPVIGGSLASRTALPEQSLNWSLSLAQELEIAGQRGLRLDVADNELSAQEWQVAVARAAIAEEAWSAYFRVVAARERLTLASKLESATAAVAATVKGMAAEGLSSELDADVADAAATRAAGERVEAKALVETAQAHLAALLGTASTVEGPLEPLASSSSASSAPAAVRPELHSLQRLRAALRARVEVLRRSRAPNPTVSLFAQNDGFNERVLGVGLSVPIPLPQPVGRTLRGEITEAEALADKVEATLDRLQRELDAALAVARADYEAGLARRALYPPERLARATGRLETIGQQVKAGRFTVRDALVGQQALIEQLKADIDIREALCLASVRLTRAAGLSLEGAAP